MEAKYTDKQALTKLQAFCAYQERCPQEIRQKLRTWGFDATETDQIIAQLQADDFLNEARYAAAFVGGKFRMKHWGKIKIQQSLALKGISSKRIQAAIKAQIADDDYIATLRDILRRKAAALPDDLHPQAQKQKIAAYALAAGYEPALVWEHIEQLHIHENGADE